EKKVLLVDLDPQANASSGLGYPRGAVTGSIYQVLLGDETLPGILVPTELPHLKLAPATNDLAGAEVELVMVETRREHRLADALAQVSSGFDYVLIDTPPSLGLLTLNGLVAAGTVLIPMQCEYFALEGLGALMQTVERVSGKLNPALAVEGILLCMYD